MHEQTQRMLPSMPARVLGVLCVLSVTIPAGLHARQPTSRVGARGVQEVVAPGVPVERELASGQTHSYLLTLGGEECVRIAVEQRGVDATIVVRDASGRAVREENRLASTERSSCSGRVPVRARSR